MPYIIKLKYSPKRWFHRSFFGVSGAERFISELIKYSDGLEIISIDEVNE